MKSDLKARLADLRSRTREEALPLLEELLTALETGEIRAARPDSESETGWTTETWVKQAILAAFAHGLDKEHLSGMFAFRDRDTLPPRNRLSEKVRVVPGGTAVRRGAHVGEGVVIMPPAYVNVGAFVDRDCMIDSHALVGSCAQVGCRVHLSAAAQVGGVLEPVSASPVIVEDDVFVGGNAGLYEGILVKRRAVLAAGVVLTSSSRVYDLVRHVVHTADPSNGRPLVIPENSVVVMGSRPASGEFAQKHGLGLLTPLIVKVRDGRTDAKTALEEVLR